jgi:uncharacterized protein
MAEFSRALPGAGRITITAYGNGGFRLDGSFHLGPVLLLPGRALDWPPATLADVTVESLAQVLHPDAGIELLLLGTGADVAGVPKAVRAALAAARIGVEGMATGAACRTFNVLANEGRLVGAALLPVP